MKRILCCAAAIFLASCSFSKTPPAEDILRQSINARPQLLSSSYDLEVHMHHMRPQGALLLSAHLRGRQRDSAAAFEATAEVKGAMDHLGGTSPLFWSGALIFLQPDLYVFTDEGSLLWLEKLLGKDINAPQHEWIAWEQNLDSTAALLQPEMLRALQTRGTEAVRGRKCYVVDVTVNPTLLEGQDVTVTGTAWIDAQTYFLCRISWKIQGRDTSEGVIDDTVTLEVFDHNEEVRIVAPPLHSTVPADVQ